MKFAKLSVFATLAVLFSGASFAQAATVQILGGETAPAAKKLAALLSGNSVVLDAKTAEVLSCDAEAGSCSITNSSYAAPAATYDYAIRLTLDGAEADALFSALPAGSSATYKYFPLGFSGQYGSDELRCEKVIGSTHCEIHTLYSYYPGG